MMANKILAAGSVALMGAGSLLGATAANAFSAADCEGTNTDFMTGLIGDSTTLCFASAVSAGDYTFTPPPGTTAIEVIVAGAGGGAGTWGYGYGGNGGAVTFIDDISPTDVLEIHLGEGGAPGWNNDSTDGETSTVSSTDTDWTALGGDAGQYVTGQSGSGNDYGLAGDGWTQHGAGARSDGTDLEPGAGWTINDPELVGVNNALWPAGDASTYGTGGKGDQDTDDNWGNGGDAYWDNGAWALEPGEDGAVEIHYTLGGPLAATGVDAAPMGIAAAGMLVAGGIGLAIARRARRSK